MLYNWVVNLWRRLWKRNRWLNNWTICAEPLLLVPQPELQVITSNKHLMEIASYNDSDWGQFEKTPFLIDQSSCFEAVCFRLSTLRLRATAPLHQEFFLAALNAPCREGDPTITLITPFNVHANRTIWAFCSNFTNEWPCNRSRSSKLRPLISYTSTVKDFGVTWWDTTQWPGVGDRWPRPSRRCLGKDSCHTVSDMKALSEGLWGASGFTFESAETL